MNIISKNVFTVALMFFATTSFAQVQNAAAAKVAQVDVTVADKTGKPYNNEVVLFKGGKASHDYQGITDSLGKFSTKLPVGDKYEIMILGFKDSTSYMVLDIPELQNKIYTTPFKVDIEFTPMKNFVLEGVNFDFGKATLQPGSEPLLDELVAFLMKKDDEMVEIGGHTDNVGSQASNLKLSQERANTVMQYLIGKGVNPARLVAKGYGMSQPIESNKTEDGRASNRRMEVKFL